MALLVWVLVLRWLVPARLAALWLVRLVQVRWVLRGWLLGWLGELHLLARTWSVTMPRTRLLLVRVAQVEYRRVKVSLLREPR